MDIAHLEKLAQLAGLDLEGTDREKLLRDINALEALAATLPSLEHTPPAAAPPTPLEPAVAPLRWDLVLKNAPALADGFFRIPGVPHQDDPS